MTITGSERAGAAVAEQAGRSLKKVVLEMGGSDPLIILEDADLDHAVQSAVFGRMFNTGQCCVGSKRIIVVGKDRGDAALRAFTEQMAALQAGDPMDLATTLGPLSSQRALDLLLEQIEIAEKDGARVVVGGGRIDRPGFYLEPTVLTGIDETNAAYNTEFFGPVRGVLRGRHRVRKRSSSPTTPRSVWGHRSSPPTPRAAEGSRPRSTAAWSL